MNFEERDDYNQIYPIIVTHVIYVLKFWCLRYCTQVKLHISKYLLKWFISICRTSEIRTTVFSYIDTVLIINKHSKYLT